MRISLHWRRPAPLDVLTPAMQWGRFRTWLGAALLRSRLRRDRDSALAVYRQVHETLKVSLPLPGPNDGMARFAAHVSGAGAGKTARYLEIGACEGHSTAFVHAILGGNVLITVVDPFAESAEIDDAVMRNAFTTFSANMRKIQAEEKVRVLKGRSVDHLPKLLDAGEQFDIIYIDGSHEILDVLVDAALCWRLLASDGLMIFDDYWYRRPDLGTNYRPKLAIDGFVGAMSPNIAVLDVGRQVFIRKR